MHRILSLVVVALLAQLACTPFRSHPIDGGTDSGTDAQGESFVSPSPTDAHEDFSVVDLSSEGAQGDAILLDVVADTGAASSRDAAFEASPDADGSEPDILPPGSASDLPDGGTLPTTGLLIRLEADYGLTTDGFSASRWKDQSGNGLDAKETDPSFRPDYVDDVNAGYGAVLFDSVGQDLSFGDGFSTLQDGLSLFLVVGLNSDASGVCALLQTTPNGPVLTLKTGTTQGVMDIDYYVGSGTTTPGHVYNYAYTSWHLVEVIQQGGAGGSVSAFSAYFDGTSVVSASQPVANNQIKTASLGPVITDSAGFGLQAVLVYSRVVSNSERQEIEQILMTKWQVAP
jgi:hypothetical protein